MILFCLLALFSPGSPFNVLVLSPSFAGSHMNFMAHLADTLTDAGHNVTFLVPIVDEAARNRLSVKSTKDVVLVERDSIMQNEQVFFDEFVENIWTLETDSPTWDKTFQFFNKLMVASCANLFRNRQVFAELLERHFDVAILEPISVCGLGLFKGLGIEKVALASSVTLYEAVLSNTGEPVELSYVPVWNSPFDDKMNMLERFRNYQFSRDFHHNIEKMFDLESAIYRELLGSEIPEWRELMPAASLFFTNSIPYVDFPRPVLQKTVPIGGITVDIGNKQWTSLSADWNSILDKRPLNMMVSFGSMMKSSKMPQHWRDTLLHVMRSEPNVTFIWKYESEDVRFAEGVENVHFAKWIPQTALLNDPRLSAFLTHGGLGSINEVVYAGKPTVIVPVFCDQPRNARMMERHETAIVVDKTDLEDFDTVKKAVSSILHEPKYTENAKRLADLVSNQPNPPKESLVKNVEFLARFGPFPLLDPAGRHLNFMQRSLLDVWIAQFLVVFVVSVGVIIIVHRFKKPSIVSRKS